MMMAGEIVLLMNHLRLNFSFSVYVSDEFRSKVACENEIVQLTCNPYSRIAIYSASYGRTEYESIQCAQPQGVREESKCAVWCGHYIYTAL